MKKIRQRIKRIFSRQGEGGYVLTWVLILALVAGFVMAPFLMFMHTGVSTSYAYADNMTEFYAADSGIEDGLYKIAYDFSADTALDGDIDDDSNTITVVANGTVPFPDSGIISIGAELIRYSSKDDEANTFTVYDDPDTTGLDGRGWDMINEVNPDNSEPTEPADHDDGAIVTTGLPDNIKVGNNYTYGIKDINSNEVEVTVETIWTLWGLEDESYAKDPPHNDMAVVGQMLATTSTRLLEAIDAGDDVDEIVVSSTLSFPEATGNDPSIIRIDDELFEYTGTEYDDNGTSGDESDDFYLFTGVTRAFNDTEAADHAANAAVTSEEVTYEITAIWNDTETANMPKVQTIGCWLPPGFDYVPGTSNLGSELTEYLTIGDDDIEVEDVTMFAIDPDVEYGVVCVEHELIKYTAINTGLNALTGCERGYGGTEEVEHNISGNTIYVLAEPNQKGHHGGTALEWPLSNTYFDELPREVPAMEGAEMPDEYPLTRVITFSFSPAGEPMGAFSWLRFLSADIALAWDTSGGTYKITSTATDPETGTHTTLESYVGAKELTDRDAIVQGDARVIGNSLMLDESPDIIGGVDHHLKDTIIESSSASIGDEYGNEIPEGATVEAAYLYWSAFKARPEDISGEDLGDLADEVNKAVFTVADGDTNYITADSTQILSSNAGDGWVFSCFKDVTDLLDVNRELYADITIYPTSGYSQRVIIYDQDGGFNDLDIRITADSSNPGNMVVIDEDGDTVYIAPGGYENFSPNNLNTVELRSGETAGFYDATITVVGPNDRGRVDGDGVDNVYIYYYPPPGQSNHVDVTLETAEPTPGTATITPRSTTADIEITVTSTLGDDDYITVTGDDGTATLDKDNTSVTRELVFNEDVLTCGTLINYDLLINCTDGVVEIAWGTQTVIIGESNTQTNGDYTFGLDPDVPFVVDSYGWGDLYGDTMDEGSYAGWALIIIYSHPDEEAHQLFLYDTITYLGNYADNVGGYLETTISGFVVPEDFDGYVTYFVGEGDEQYGAHQYPPFGTYLGRDKWADEEYISLNGYSLYEDPVNPQWNIMNSQSSVLGIPEDEQNNGVDIDTYSLEGIMDEGDSSATIKMDTGVDGWTLVFLFLTFKTEPTEEVGQTPIAVNTFSFK